MTPRAFTAVIMLCAFTGCLLLCDVICHLATGAVCPWPWRPPPTTTEGNE